MQARKSRGSAAVLAYRGHLLTENRNGLVVSTRTTQAYGAAERDAALLMAEDIPGNRRITLGADKGYDVHDFVGELRHMNVTPHVAQNDTNRRSAIDQRTTHHDGYRVSQRKRKRIEEVFGWMKTVGLLRKLRHRGLEQVGWVFTFTAAAYNLVRIRNLIGSTPQPKCA
jgi:IS5 family transposase